MKSFLLVVLFVFPLTACSSARTPAAPLPTVSPMLSTAPATAAPTTIPLTTTPTTVPPTAVPTPTVFAPEISEFPNLGGADVFGDEASAGQYKSRAYFSIPFTFETNKVYRGMYEGFPHGQIFGLAQGRAELSPKMLLFWAFDSTVSVDQLITELRATPRLSLNPNQPASLAGIQGTQIEAMTQGPITIPALGNLIGHVGSDWQPNSAQVELHFIVLPVNGRTLLVYIEAPKDEFPTFLPDALQVLSTVKFAVNTP